MSTLSIRVAVSIDGMPNICFAIERPWAPSVFTLSLFAILNTPLFGVEVVVTGADGRITVWPSNRPNRRAGSAPASHTLSTQSARDSRGAFARLHAAHRADAQ